MNCVYNNAARSMWTEHTGKSEDRIWNCLKNISGRTKGFRHKCAAFIHNG